MQMENSLKGIISFVNHEKKYVTISYLPGGKGKEKTVNGNVDDKTQEKGIAEGIIKKKHRFHIGDTVSFIIKLSDRGDKMIAANIRYLFNEALDVLLNKAKTNNVFKGYIKEVDGIYYIKEMDSYRFFPLEVSPWQLPFSEREKTEALEFRIINPEKKEKATAELTRNNLIPAFYKAEQLFKNKTPVHAAVSKVTAYGVIVNICGEQIQAKIPLDGKNYKTGDKITLQIAYLSPKKIIVEQV
jgi:ribosomal protein S1